MGRAIAKAGIVQVGRYVKPIAADQVLPVQGTDSTPFPGVGRTGPVAIILHSAIYIEREVFIRADVVELGDGDIFGEVPTFAVVESNAQSTVATDDEVMRVVGVHPKRVKVGVYSFRFIGGDHGNRVEGDAPVVAQGQGLVDVVEPVGVFAVYGQVLEVEGAVVGEFGGIVDFFPGFSGIVAAVERIFSSFYLGIDAVGIAGGDSDADPAQVAAGQALFRAQFFPGFPSVVRYEEPGAWAAGSEGVRGTAVFVEGGEEFLWVLWVHDEVGDPGAGIREEDAGPGFAAVGRFVEASVRAGCKGVAHSSGIDRIGVGGVYEDAVYGLGGFQAEALPGFAAIPASEDTPAEVHGVSWVAFSGTDPDHVGVALLDADGADVLGCLFVKNRYPG